MASVERPTFTQTIPEHARRVTEKGITYAIWTDRLGQSVKALVLPSGKCRRTVTKKWIGVYRDEHGKKRKTATFGDRSVALDTALKLEKLAQAVREGRTTAHQPVSGNAHLVDNIEDYLAHLEVRGCTPKHREEVERDLRRILAGSGVTTAASVNCDRLDVWLERERRSGARRATKNPKPLSIRSRNKWAKKLKAFGAWLDRTGRTQANPFRRLTVANEAADPRHVRRAISVEDLLQLINVTWNSEKIRRALSGRDRAALYILASYTGLRAGALLELKPESFHVSGGCATSVTARAETQKGLKTHTVPLPQDVGQLLGKWLEEKPAGKPVWFLSSYWEGDTSKLLRFDLKAAKLPYRDASGAVFDFHALRGQCATLLVRAGVDPATVQRILDHSDPRLTARYTRLASSDLVAGVSKLPSLGTLGSLGTSLGTEPGESG